ncbi:preprotein translocase subunit SecE [Buchnera aphidicola]|uniref:Preprotein translocase subunit SecE n=1 Tax=Buchnera aphidicola (Anoecia oenotherae) TaxID=1241833 RepID=A0A4D6XUJ7_9GAMM|nr:preprotein translocase subunit SecE [Buchnera aphidicola]QCI19179.1 preprotein translocase subunit SecE [Buchnera aphidicola (Anoecia oenotherae)]
MGYNCQLKTFFNLKEWYKWLFIFLSYCIIEISNFYKEKLWIFFYILIISTFLICIVTTIFYTKIARYLIYLLIESKKEIKNIIRPSIKDTFYTSLIIIIITVLISLVIYGIDKTFFYLISCIIKLGC